MSMRMRIPLPLPPPRPLLLVLLLLTLCGKFRPSCSALDAQQRHVDGAANWSTADRPAGAHASEESIAETVEQTERGKVEEAVAAAVTTSSNGSNVVGRAAELQEAVADVIAGKRGSTATTGDTTSDRSTSVGPRDVKADADADADVDTDADADAIADANADGHADANADANADVHADAHADANATSYGGQGKGVGADVHGAAASPSLQHPIQRPTREQGGQSEKDENGEREQQRQRRTPSSSDSKGSTEAGGSSSPRQRVRVVGALRSSSAAPVRVVMGKHRTGNGRTWVRTTLPSRRSRLTRLPLRGSRERGRRRRRGRCMVRANLRVRWLCSPLSEALNMRRLVDVQLSRVVSAPAKILSRYALHCGESSDMSSGGTSGGNESSISTSVSSNSSSSSSSSSSSGSDDGGALTARSTREQAVEQSMHPSTHVDLSMQRATAVPTVALTACPRWFLCSVRRARLTQSTMEGKAQEEPQRSLLSLSACASVFGDGASEEEEEASRLDPPVNCQSAAAAVGMARLRLRHTQPSTRNNTATSTRHRNAKGNAARTSKRQCMQAQDMQPRMIKALDVVCLRNVYVNGYGLVFNQRFLFSPRLDKGKYYEDYLTNVAANTMMVARVKEPALNLGNRWASNIYHAVVETLPVVLQLAPFLARQPRHLVLVYKKQFDAYERLMEPLVGVPLRNMRRIMVTGDVRIFHRTLMRFGTLLQPVVEDTPNRYVWRFLRSRYLLPEGRLPIFKPDWTPRVDASKLLPMSSRDMAKYPPRKWVVVVARRLRRKRVARQMGEIVRRARHIFTQARVVEFFGNLPIMEAHKLFRRARLLVAEHGAAETNLVFMPANASVLEIRPRGYPVACYNYLAYACDLNYYLVLGDGFKDTPMNVNVSRVVNVLRSISHTMRLT